MNNGEIKQENDKEGGMKERQKGNVSIVHQQEKDVSFHEIPHIQTSAPPYASHNLQRDVLLISYDMLSPCGTHSDMSLLFCSAVGKQSYKACERTYNKGTVSGWNNVSKNEIYR